MSAILFIDHAAALGGAEHSLLLLQQHLDRKRWQPHLAAPPGKLYEQAAAEGIPTHAVTLPRLRRSLQFPLNWWQHAGELAHIAHTLPAQALHANTVRAALYTAVAAHRVRLPFIWHMRDFWLSESQPRFLWLDRLLKQLLMATATAVITNSHAVAAHLPPVSKVTVIHNGIDVTHFDPARDGDPFRHQFGIPLDAPLVGMVGRLRPWKGQTRFLAVAQRVLATMPKAHFTVVGGDPFRVHDGYARQITDLTAQYGLSHSVTFTGQLDDVRAALAAMDLFVHPGDPEPFGLVNVEAMAMSKPVVAFAHGALPEIVVDGETGVLIPPGDEEEMADKIVHLLSDTKRRERLGRNGRLRADTHFDIRRTAAQIEAIYSRILSHP